MNLDELVQRPDWVRHAACRGLPTAWFFPEQGGDTIGPRRICAGCPVRTECAEAGESEAYGVWGGRSIQQRRNGRRGAA